MKKPVFLVILSGLLLSGCGPTKISSNPQSSPVASPTQSSTKENEVGVPLPTGEDIVRAFFNLINEKRILEAVAMLSREATPNEATKQTWGVNFNSLESITVKSINEWQKEVWADDEVAYKVTVVAKVKPESSFHAWADGENIKWINLKKEAGLWKIFQIASGP